MYSCNIGNVVTNVKLICLIAMSAVFRDLAINFNIYRMIQCMPSIDTSMLWCSAVTACPSHWRRSPFADSRSVTHSLAIIKTLVMRGLTCNPMPYMPYERLFSPILLILLSMSIMWANNDSTLLRSNGLNIAHNDVISCALLYCCAVVLSLSADNNSSQVIDGQRHREHGIAWYSMV